MTSTKSRLAATLLVFFLGTIGIHRFYVGKIASGIVMILLTITGIGLIVTSIWALIDFITIVVGSFRDGDGAKITKW